MGSKRKSYKYFLLAVPFVLFILLVGIIAQPLINKATKTFKVLAAVNEWVIEKDATTSNLKFYYNDQSPSMTISTSGGVTATSFAGDGSALTNISAAGVPQGAVMFFNLAACPTGWTELTQARGRYIVGLPSATGTLPGTPGTACTDDTNCVGTALANKENRPVGQHSHPITDNGHDHQLSIGGGVVSAQINSGGYTVVLWGTSYTFPQKSLITVNSTGQTPGTNAPYIQLLACQKN